MAERTLKIGLDAKLYRNTGTVSVPIFDLIPQLKDAELGLEKDSADASSRASTWRKFIGTLKDSEVTFQLLSDGANEDFNVLLDSFLNGTQVYFAIMDGDIATVGSQGLTAWYEVMSMPRGEPLEDMLVFDITLKLAAQPDVTEDPVWLVVT
ncbi:hypothetical protein IID23_05080 [Patescibacteria group bacterium]|nr:hypothetical protein [Patescibacteria group bacterium]